MIKETYFHFIKEQRKIVEGRINRGRYSLIRPGDVIQFMGLNPKNILYCNVERVTQYRSFRQMLQLEGLENCLPTVKTLEEGEKIYHSFPHYKEEEKKYGILAFRIHLKKA